MSAGFAGRESLTANYMIFRYVVNWSSGTLQQGVWRLVYGWSVNTYNSCLPSMSQHLDSVFSALNTFGVLCQLKTCGLAFLLIHCAEMWLQRELWVGSHRSKALSMSLFPLSWELRDWWQLGTCQVIPVCTTLLLAQRGFAGHTTRHEVPVCLLPKQPPATSSGKKVTS